MYIHNQFQYSWVWVYYGLFYFKNKHINIIFNAGDAFSSDLSSYMYIVMQILVSYVRSVKCSFINVKVISVSTLLLVKWSTCCYM